MPWIQLIVVTLALLVWLYYAIPAIPTPWKIIAIILPVGLYCYYLLGLAGVV